MQGYMYFQPRPRSPLLGLMHVLRIISLGLRMDDTTLRIAIGLWLGNSICAAHLCHHCGAEVDCLGTHGLRCWHSEG